jgi:hypothetical protein
MRAFDVVRSGGAERRVEQRARLAPQVHRAAAHEEVRLALAAPRADGLELEVDGVLAERE